MDKLFLLDAYALIYRSYYAFIKNPRINSKGLNTSAIVGFVNTLQEVLTKEQPTHIGVAFDPHGPTFRSEAYPAYKAQREATPEDIRKAVPIIKDLLRAWNIPILQVDGFEADDVIGTLATKAGAQGIDTYMLTPDKDYGQLVSDHVFIFRPRHGGGYETMGVEEVKEKYAIPSTESVIDLLALMGDSSDNFPGCPGVGEKTAVKLINEFGTVEEMLRRVDEIKGALKNLLFLIECIDTKTISLSSLLTKSRAVMRLFDSAKARPNTDPSSNSSTMWTSPLRYVFSLLTLPFLTMQNLSIMSPSKKTVSPDL